MARTKLQMQDISDVLRNISEAFQAPELVTAPFTTITDLSGNARKLPDPSKTVKLSLGIERVIVPDITLIKDEKGPNGEQVWGPANKDARIRLVGKPQPLSETYGSRGLRLTAQPTDGYIEVTFYGTRLNILTLADGGVRTFQAAVDGGSLATFQSTVVSSVLGARNYRQNLIYSTIPTQILGLHTVRIQNSTGSLEVFGFEFINDSTQITIPKGKIFNEGKGLSLNSNQTLDYSSDFAVGTPNGRGGRVVVYSENNEIKKAIQPTDSTAAFLSATNHQNEEAVRSIDFRAFGANRTDDFSTLGNAVSDRAFTLEDGTTSLVGNDVIVSSPAGGPESIRASGAGSFITIMFVGTGLDILTGANDANARDTIISVNGTSVGTLTIPASESSRIKKIVSGLPYGTHVVKFAQTGAFDTVFITDFIIHAPKKPAIPETALELGEYFLMANFVGNTVAATDTISTGVLRKASWREITYVNGTGGTSDWIISTVSGAITNGDIIPEIVSDRQNAYFEYTFFGTGAELRFRTNPNRSANIQVSLQSLSTNGNLQNLTTTNFPSMISTTYGTGVTFNSSTGVLDQNDAATTNGCGFRVSNLPLGSYKIRFNNNTASAYLIIDTLDIITPVNYPNSRIGSLSMGPEIEIKKLENISNVDLGKAKAWVNFSMSNQLIYSSHNISAVLRLSTGRADVHFEKPFKTSNYIVAGSCRAAEANMPADGNQVDIFQLKPSYASLSFPYNSGAGTGNDLSTDPTIVSIVFFGELEDEGD